MQNSERLIFSSQRISLFSSVSNSEHHACVGNYGLLNRDALIEIKGLKQSIMRDGREVHDEADRLWLFDNVYVSSSISEITQYDIAFLMDINSHSRFNFSLSSSSAISWRRKHSKTQYGTILRTISPRHCRSLSRSSRCNQQRS